jgi:hypothetical protein
MVRAAGAKILAPVRKSAHSLWIHVPNGTTVGARRGQQLPTGTEPGSVGEEPVLIVPRGHQLPFRTPKPLRIAVNKLDLDAKEASVRFQFFSSAGGNHRIPLFEREARFERHFMGNLMKRLGRLPWAKGVDEDQFELLIMADVNENELLTAELVIVRYFRGKEVDVQRQKLRVASTGSADKRAGAPTASFA